MQGLYLDDVRVLSQLIVTVDGEEPVPLGHDLIGGGSNNFDSAVFNVGRAVRPDLVPGSTAQPDTYRVVRGSDALLLCEGAS